MLSHLGTHLRMALEFGAPAAHMLGVSASVDGLEVVRARYKGVGGGQTPALGQSERFRPMEWPGAETLEAVLWW